jgi:hypothetical protein
MRISRGMEVRNDLGMEHGPARSSMLHGRNGIRELFSSASLPFVPLNWGPSCKEEGDTAPSTISDVSSTLSEDSFGHQGGFLVSHEAKGGNGITVDSREHGVRQFGSCFQDASCYDADDDDVWFTMDDLDSSSTGSYWDDPESDALAPDCVAAETLVPSQIACPDWLTAGIPLDAASKAKKSLVLTAALNHYRLRSR